MGCLRRSDFFFFGDYQHEYYYKVTYLLSKNSNTPVVLETVKVKKKIVCLPFRNSLYIYIGHPRMRRCRL